MNSDRKYSLNYGQMLKDRMSVDFDDTGIEDRWEEFEASAFFLLADSSERENRVYPF